MATPEVDGRLPRVEADTIKTRDIIPSQGDAIKTMDVYCVLVGRIFAERIPAFKCMGVLPEHIPHSASAKMAQRSEIFSLPLIFKNEMKYEECFDILDMYEQEVVKMYTEAHGMFVITL